MTGEETVSEGKGHLQGTRKKSGLSFRLPGFLSHTPTHTMRSLGLDPHED